MPTVITRITSGKNKGKVRVSTPHGTKSKATTMAKAKKQQRLLNAIEHNPNFKPRKR